MKRHISNEEMMLKYLKKSFRQSYISLIYRVLSLQNDDQYKERYMIDIDFVHSAGSYETNAVDQLMNILENKKD